MATTQPLTSQRAVYSTRNVLAGIGVGAPLKVCFEKSTNTS